MPTWLQQDWCSSFVLALGHFVWQGTLIAVVLAIALRATKTVSVRYWLSLTTLLVMAVCPIATLGWLMLPESPVATLDPLAIVREVPAPSQQTIPTASAKTASNVGQVSNVPVIPPAPPIEFNAERSGRSPNLRFPTDDQSWWQKFAPQLTTTYLCGVALMLLRLVFGLWGGRRLRRRVHLIDDPSLLAAMRRQATALGLKLLPVLAYCERVTVPTVVGVLKPMILLPLTLTSGLSPEQIESVLAHELAHLRRYDHLFNLLQRVIESLLFFHPAMWWVSHRIREEREHCCDDLVVACGAMPLDYAKSLLRVAELSRSSKLHRSVAAVSLLATGDKPSSLRQRIARLLGESATPSLRVSPRALLLAIGIPLVALIVTIQSGAGRDRVARPESSKGVAEAEDSHALRKASERATQSESPDPALDPTAGLPNSDEETNPPNNVNGDLRFNPAAGSGDPRRAQVAEDSAKAKAVDDELFLTVIKGQARNLEFEQPVKKVEGFDAKIVNISTASPKLLRVEGATAGLTIVTVTDEKGTEFAVPIEVVPASKSDRVEPVEAAFQPKPRKNPLLSAVEIQQAETSIDLGVKQDRVLAFPQRVRRIDGFDPLVINVVAVDPRQVRVSGLLDGTTSFIAQTEGDEHSVKFVVKQITHTRDSIRKLFTTPPPESKEANAGKPHRAQSPAIRGEILSVEPNRNEVDISLGEDDGVKPRMKFQILEKETKDNRNQPPVVKGTIEVIRIERAKATARILQVRQNGDPAKEDIVVPLKESEPRKQHGEISWVAPEHKTVWINLGVEEGIKKGMKFRVHEKETKDNRNQPPVVKGKIEVVRVIDRKTTEARIIEEQVNDTLAKGDPVVAIDDADRQPNNANGDLRSNPAAGSGDPRRAKVIEQAVAFLKSQQQVGGTWPGEPVDGVTALAAAALLQAGVKADDPVLQKALVRLRTVEPTQTYTVALQMMVFCGASPKEDAELIRRNVAWLEKAQVTTGQSRGAWSYGVDPGGRGDGSCSRFAVLGLDAAKQAGFAVQEETWRRVSDYWLTNQRENGGWGYTPAVPSTLTMTLSGIAGLATANRHLPRDEQSQKREAAILKPERFIEKSLPDLAKATFALYAFQSLERAAHLSEITRFGELDWKAIATKHLLETQHPNGFWKSGNESDVIATGLALLTLTGQPELGR